MMNGLVLLHRNSDRIVWVKILGKNDNNVQGISILERCTEGEGYDDFQENVLTHLKGEMYSDMSIDYILFESNYGRAGASVFAKIIYSGLKELFPKALIVAYSGTVESLNSALLYDTEIMACINQISDKIDPIFSQQMMPRIVMRTKLCAYLEGRFQAAEDLDSPAALDSTAEPQFTPQFEICSSLSANSERYIESEKGDISPFPVVSTMKLN